jgi:subtilase family serine protease
MRARPHGVDLLPMLFRSPAANTINRELMKMKTHWILAIAFSVLLSSSANATASVERSVIRNNTPAFVSTAKNLGPANSAEVIDVSIWLNLHNRGEMDALVPKLYARDSSSYRQWLKLADIVAKFAPTAQEAAAVGEFLTSHGLAVVKVDPYNFVVRAQGTIANFEKLFQVQISTFELNGNTYRANTTDPSVEGPAAGFIQAVSGLDNLVYTHPLTQRVARNQSAPAGNADVSAAFINDVCFPGTVTETYTTGGTDPIATYKGNGYNATTTGCGYVPANIQAAYNLNGLYNEGFDGTGQTIVIIDWCGSPTIKADANAFSAKFGLPPLTKSNFQILYSGTTPTCAGPDPEINIDVEWSHAIAPGANIALVVPPSALFQDIDNGELYAIENNLGNVISGSYGSEELYTATSELGVENAINEIAALRGISADFASGDYGDYTFDIGPPYEPASVSAPADSPYATAVGGVSLALNANNTIAWQAGWGTNETLLIDAGTIYDPPINFGFEFGSGGGPSAVFSKPPFQSSIPGSHRRLPDIAWLADPFTGGVIAISEPFVFPALEWTVYGGTSLATPMFSALWAIANQEAGTALGQAAQYLYSMPARTITDVVPVGSTTNATASIKEPTVTNHYTAAELAAPLEGTTKFVSTLWNIPDEEDTVYVITFGTDTGLKTAPGWDDVTGLGTPNGQAFADYFDPSK